METQPNRTERLKDPRLRTTFVPLPRTVRGQSTVLHRVPPLPSFPVNDSKESKAVTNDSTDCRLVYCAGKLVILRDLVNPSHSIVYRGHNDRTTVATVSPSGYYIASGDVTGHVRVWSIDHPEHLLKLELFVFNGEVKDLQWDPESRRIVAVGDGKSSFARVFAWDTGNSVGEIIGPQKRILSVDYKPTRPFRIVTGSEDYNLCFFQGPPFKFSRNINGIHQNFVNCVRYSPSGDTFLSVSSDKSIALLDGKTGDLQGKFKVEHTASVYTVSWHPKGSMFVTASADKSIKVWNVENKDKSLSTIAMNQSNSISDMQVSALWVNEQQIVSISLCGDINVFNVSLASSPSVIDTLQGHQVNVLALDTVPSCGYAFTGSYDGVVCVWDLQTSKACRLEKGHTGKIVQISMNLHYMASIAWDDTVRVLSFENLQRKLANQSKEEMKEKMEYEKTIALECQPNGLAMPANGDNLQVISTNHTIVVVLNYEIVYQTEKLSYSPKCIAISSDGQSIAVGTDNDKKIELYRFERKTLSLVKEGELVGHLGTPTCMAYSPNNEYLAVGDAYREVRVWDLAKRTEKIKSLWVYHSTTVTSVDWSPSGQSIISGSLDEYIYLWNFEKPQEKEKYEYTHKDGVTRVKFYDENRFYSVGNDGCINEWSVEKK